MVKRVKGVELAICNKAARCGAFKEFLSVDQSGEALCELPVRADLRGKECIGGGLFSSFILKILFPLVFSMFFSRYF